MAKFKKLKKVLPALTLSFLVSGLQSTIHAQEPKESTAKKSTLTDNEDATMAKFHDYFESKSKEMEFCLEGSDTILRADKTPVRRVLKFSSTNEVYGAVYVWFGEDRRPCIIGALGSVLIRKRDYGFVELHNLTSSKLKDVRIDGLNPKVWRPIAASPTEPISDAPSVATTDNFRLVQMRNLAKSYMATINMDGKTSELRLMPQPLFRYEDSTVDRDGAIFSYVVQLGTDPELLLRIESNAENGTPVWCMQPIRFTWRGLTLKKDDKQIWEVPDLVTREDLIQTSPYITTLSEAINLR